MQGNGTAIVITSGKGGVGKTTTTANIGTGLALRGKRVCLVDLDIGLRNLDVVLGLDNRIIYDIVDVAAGRAKLHQALVRDKRFDDKLYLLPAAQNADKDDLRPEEVKAIVDDLKTEFDFVLLDCPAGIEQGFRNAVAGADGAIVVTTPEISAVSDADRVIGLLEQEKMALAPQLIINRIRRHMMNDGEMMDVDDITRHLSISLLGIVFDDDAVIATSNKGEPVVMDPNDRASQGYRNIVRRMLGESVPLMSMEEKKESFWQRLFHHHKKRN
ncbi:MAG: septum site-determining protein MinD [Candidatus Paralactobacillus gallistercoris]|uniref:Septum site-determining protein MinD n=1 Tax=Candidatus Paralactobacillus gallistercoris TaxID=2838724 RepID=A0A948TK83_9LACO|nr:septum site-determining protein MinD [Candidatus Paralactobacillus gallistercoris]